MSFRLQDQKNAAFRLGPFADWKFTTDFGVIRKQNLQLTQVASKMVIHSHLKVQL
jgi:hypothetical protein